MTTAADLNLNDIRSLTEALARIPNGKEAAALAERLHVWTSPVHREHAPLASFVLTFSNLTPEGLSDLNARTVAEASRAFELVGLLSGLESHLKMTAKSTRGRSRARLLREAAAPKASTDGEAPKAEKVKAPTGTELADLVEEDPIVIEIDHLLSYIQIILSAAGAYKEALLMQKEAISREITYRCALINAGAHR